MDILNRLIIITTFIAIRSLTSSIQAQEPDYYQQWVEYKIEVRLDDSLHGLHGHIRMHYHNNSPDALEYIWIHLWPNGYKNNETALGKQLSGQPGSFVGNRFPFAPADQRGYIDSLSFSGDGKPLEWDYHPEHIDIARVELNQPLQSGGTIELSTPFYVKLPKSGFSRLGHSGQSYQISQWYPKPAVYDSEGWQPMPYLNIGEFYSEYGRFDVSLTLPANYRVASTGYLQNPGEIAWRDSLAAAPCPDDVVMESPVPPSSVRMKTIRYVADSVHDFAWFADKRYVVDKKASPWKMAIR